MKGIIVAAGYGTRFLPVTKTLPKEMLPLVNKPAVSFVVDEFIESGIREIIIITSRRKKALEDYFDREAELESVFTRENSEKKLSLIRPPEADVVFIRQQEMRGTGHALLQAKPYIGDEPAVVAYPDDIHFGSPPLAAQLISVWKETSCSVLATIHDPENINAYAAVDIAEDGLHVQGLVEKPPKGTEPSHEASIGRYLYTPDFFRELEEGWKIHQKEGTGEYYHVYPLTKQLERNGVVYKRIEGKRYDTGTPEGFLTALGAYCGDIPEFRDALLAGLKEMNS
ncbi:MAG: UTP--glucose-1-phosphate uridylyltransferase [Spirochaetia bacterium]